MYHTLLPSSPTRLVYVFTADDAILMNHYQPKSIFQIEFHPWYFTFYRFVYRCNYMYLPLHYHRVILLSYIFLVQSLLVILCLSQPPFHSTPGTYEAFFYLSIVLSFLKIWFDDPGKQNHYYARINLIKNFP